MAIQWIIPKRGTAPGTRLSSAAFRLSSYKSGKHKPPQGVITVYAKTMRDLRWQTGDRVMVGLDGHDVYLKRVPTGGYTLSATGDKKGAARVGLSANATIKSSTLPTLSGLDIPHDQYITLEDGTVMFSIKTKANGS